MTSRSFVVYADESNTHDRSLAHRQFYGGCLVPAEDRDSLARQLGALARGLGIVGELKWRKVRPDNADRVLEVMNAFFDMIEDGRMKLRVMWLPRSMDDILRDPRYADYGYYLLYYFFIVSGFALSRHGERFEVLRRVLDRGSSFASLWRAGTVPDRSRRGRRQQEARPPAVL